ncbi:hypothetical protein [Anabaena subtropica]|nr:hypothetical protein [Anabaena subtropica]
MKSLIRTLALGAIAASCYVGQAYADTMKNPLAQSVPRTHANNT